MIEAMIKEFIAIVTFLQRTDKGFCKGKYLFVEKEEIFKLMNRNAYDTPDNKLKIWKGLRWIEAEERRLTTRLSVDGSTVPMVKISLTVYEYLAKLA